MNIHVMETIVGSIGYRVSNESSDIDRRRIFLNTINDVYSRKGESVYSNGEDGRVDYIETELFYWLRSAVAGKWQQVEYLYGMSTDKKLTEVGTFLVENRDWFITEELVGKLIKSASGILKDALYKQPNPKKEVLGLMWMGIADSLLEHGRIETIATPEDGYFGLSCEALKKHRTRQEVLSFDSLKIIETMDKKFNKNAFKFHPNQGHLDSVVIPQLEKLARKVVVDQWTSST